MPALEDTFGDVLRSPSRFDALEPDGSTKHGLSAEVLAAMARAALVREIPGVTFNEITAHLDEEGQLMKIDIDYMDEIHDPSSRTTSVTFSENAG